MYYDVKRKFLVKSANLQSLDDLHLSVVHSVFLNVDKLGDLGLSTLVGSEPTTNDIEVQVCLVKDGNNKINYWAISKVGQDSEGSAKAATPIDSNTFYTVRDSLGDKEIKKSRFAFTYLRRQFDLDVFNNGETLLLSVLLDTKTDLFALPPFVEVIKEVTDDPEYASYCLAHDIGEVI